MARAFLVTPVGKEHLWADRRTNVCGLRNVCGRMEASDGEKMVEPRGRLNADLESHEEPAWPRC